MRFLLILHVCLLSAYFIIFHSPLNSSVLCFLHKNKKQIRDAANPGMNMVVVEGGPKAVRAYVKLMTRRIRWGGDDYGDGDSDSDRSAPNQKQRLTTE